MINPIPFAVLTVLGTIGMYAAFRPWYEELSKVVDREQAGGESSKLRERRGLILWAVPIVVFGLTAVIGDFGLIVYFVEMVMQP